MNHPYKDLILDKVLAKIKVLEPLPESNLEFQSGYNYAKSEILKVVEQSKEEE